MKKYLLLIIAITWINSLNAQNIADSIVPVRLKSFEASKTANSNKLNWAVACFLNFAKFNVERSYDGINYTTINSFEADQLRCRQPFTYEDKTANGKVFYRIKVGDLDGRVYTSKITVLIGKSKGFDIASMAPTLVRSSAIVTISSASSDNAVVSITNQQGSTILKKLYALIKGNNYISLELASLATGSYILTSINSEGELKTVRFIKQ